MTVNLAVVPQGKACSKCEKEKPASDFNHNRSRLDGLQDWCRDCHAVITRKNHLQRNYGITPEDYDVMYRAQCGCCVGCGDHQSILTKALHVDHNHDTGKVRGLLCRHCNLIAGHAKDSVRTLHRITDYIAADGYTLDELKELRDRGYFDSPQ